MECEAVVRAYRDKHEIACNTLRVLSLSTVTGAALQLWPHSQNIPSNLGNRGQAAWSCFVPSLVYQSNQAADFLVLLRNRYIQNLPRFYLDLDFIQSLTRLHLELIQISSRSRICVEFLQSLSNPQIQIQNLSRIYLHFAARLCKIYLRQNLDRVQETCCKVCGQTLDKNQIQI